MNPPSQIPPLADDARPAEPPQPSQPAPPKAKSPPGSSPYRRAWQWVRSTARNIKKRLSLALWRIWLRTLRCARRPLVWVVASVCAVIVAVVRFNAAGEPREATYFVLLPEKISGDETQDKALEGLPEAVATRVGQMAEAMDHLFVEVPNLEQPTKDAPMRSVIRLQGRRGAAGLDGLPVDHFFLEWMPKLESKEQTLAKLRVTAMAGAAPLGKAGIFVRVRITKKKAQGEMSEVTLTVLLDGTVCEQTLGTVKGDEKIAPAPAVDAVASCILIHHIKHRLKQAQEALRDARAHADFPWSIFPWPKRWSVPDRYFIDIYDAIHNIGDITRQNELLVGLERYSTFARKWEDQPSEALEALATATDKIHNATRHDPTHPNVPRYPFAEYMAVHAITAARLGLPRRTGQMQATEASDHIDVHTARAFNTRPYECAKWAHAMALRAGTDASGSPKAWEDVKEKEYSACKPKEDSTPQPADSKGLPTKSASLETLAAAQSASAYFDANQWDKAIEVRWPQVANALSTTAPSTATGAKPLADVSSIEQAETLFEGGMDAMNVFTNAAQHHEVLRTTQPLVSYVERNMRRLRDAIGKLVSTLDTNKSPIIRAEIDRVKLEEKHKEMTDALTNCTKRGAIYKNCKALRPKIDAWLVAAMEASHRLALLCLNRSIETLEALRAGLCNEEPPLPECSASREGVDAGTPPGDAGPPVVDAETSTVDAATPVADAGAMDTTDAGAMAPDAGEMSVDAGPMPPAQGAPSQSRRETRRQLVQVNDILAVARLFWALQMCRAPWLTPIDLRALTAKTGEVLDRSPLAPVLAGVLSHCALLAAATTTPTGKALVGQHRGETLLDAWSWAPPESAQAFEQERVLIGKGRPEPEKGGRKIEIGDGIRARLHYPGAWEVLKTFTAAQWKSSDRRLRELYSTAQRDFVIAKQNAKKDPPPKAWDGKAQREAVWTWAMTETDGKEHTQDLKDAMATVGNELLRVAARREGPRRDGEHTCREIRALLKCSGKMTTPDYMPAECANVPDQDCPIDVEKRNYELLADPDPQKLDAVDEAIQTLAARSEDARTALANLLNRAVLAVLSPLLREAQNAIPLEIEVSKINDSGDIHTLPFVILRIAAKGRENPGLRAVLMQTSPAMAQIIAARLRKRHEDAAIALRAPDLIAALQQSTPFTDHGLPASTEKKAIAALDRAAPKPCWPEPKDANLARAKRRWLRRFLSHVALKQHFYHREDPIDRAAFGPLDLVTSYQAWCEWASDGTSPLVKDEEVLALTWLWQGDAVGEKGKAYVDGDDLPDYLVARGLLEVDSKPNQALYNGRGLASGEGNLLRARAAVRTQQGGWAVKYVFDAQVRLPSDGLALLEGELRKTEGDARLLLATRVAPKQGWGQFDQAIRAYSTDSPEASRLVARRKAAALIETSRAHPAARILRPLVNESQCWKDKWLLAIANRILGFKNADPLRALTGNEAMLTVEDLPLAIGKGDCAAPVFIGPIAKQFGRMLINENR